MTTLFSGKTAVILHVFDAEKRPLHYVMLENGTFPLNRVAKTDYLQLSALAQEEVTALRNQNGWDAT